MAGIPLIGRLSYREYLAIIVGFFFLGFETLISLIILFLPQRVIAWCYDRSRQLFHHTARNARFNPRYSVLADDASQTPDMREKKMATRILKARDFEDLCNIHGYKHEEHVVMTGDGYLLTLHRLPSRRGQERSHPGTSTGKNVVYLHHGMSLIPRSRKTDADKL